MLETFSPAMRRCIVTAREETVLLGHEAIGAEHLLLGLLRDPEDPAAALLVSSGLTADAVRRAVRDGRAGARPVPGADPLDAEALRSIGIDLDEVTDQVESVFGAGALRATPPAGRGIRLRLGMTREARLALELAQRAARAPRFGPRSRRIETAHLLLGLLRDGEGPARRLLLDAGVDPAELERAAETATGSAAES